ncbi:MAG: penicillin-binding protein 1C [Anaerolineales bacterium]|nr:penicillin-binding protein 1C [Anaerolineales bacterium]
MKKLVKWLLYAFIILIIIAGTVFYSLIRDLPSVSNLENNLHTPSIRITDRNGELLYDIIPQGVEEGRHIPVTLDQIPLALQYAVIATEDKKFYIHPGVDFGGILRSFLINLREGQIVAGGSTITQQVAQNLLLPDGERWERTYRRKLREAYLAFKIENAYSKEEILELYLNQINYGNYAYGVEAAAQTVFGKSVSKLDLAECSLLAGLPQAPYYYQPLTNLEATKERQDDVLRLMVNAGYLTEEERTKAYQEVLVFNTEPYPIHAPHFVFEIEKEIDELVTEGLIDLSNGLVIRTTLDLDYQKMAENAIEHQLAYLEKDPIQHNVNNAALIAIDPGTGEILAYVGSADFFSEEIDGAVDMVKSVRQPGSALKPIVYASLLDPEHENPLNAASVFWDVTTNFQTHDGNVYTPINYDGEEHGPVSFREALAQSLNIPAIIAMQTSGVSSVLSLAENMGITTFHSPEEYDLSLALGGGEVTLEELSNAFSVFADQGNYLPTKKILEIKNNDGELLYSPDTVTPNRVLDQRVSWLIGDILSDNTARAPQFGNNSALKLDRWAAVKTGTTTNFHDNWTIGFTPDIVVGVWVGNSNHEPMYRVSGLTGAGPIWHEFIRSVLTGVPNKIPTRPEDMIRLEVCSHSGMLPTDACPYTQYEWFIPGTEPHELDTIYHLVEIDKLTMEPATSSTPQNQITEEIALSIPPQAYNWALKNNVIIYSDQLSQLTEEDGKPTPATLIIRSPAMNSSFLISHDLQYESQKIEIQVVSFMEMDSVSLYLDDQLLGIKTTSPYSWWWQLSVGDHSIYAVGTTTGGEEIRSETIQYCVVANNE